MVESPHEQYGMTPAEESEALESYYRQLNSKKQIEIAMMPTINEIKMDFMKQRTKFLYIKQPGPKVVSDAVPTTMSEPTSTPSSDIIDDDFVLKQSQTLSATGLKQIKITATVDKDGKSTITKVES